MCFFFFVGVPVLFYAMLRIFSSVLSLLLLDMLVLVLMLALMLGSAGQRFSTPNGLFCPPFCLPFPLVLFCNHNLLLVPRTSLSSTLAAIACLEQ